MNGLPEELHTYKTLLETWQKTINLVSSSTLPHLWERHFEDSLQLLSYLPPSPSTLIDLGSGAGFPGLVLALCRRESLKVTLVEADLRKCLFLDNVSRETFLDLTVIRSRIEKISPFKQDIVTARALAPLPKLLEYAAPFMGEGSVGFFLKGKSNEVEIEMAQKEWNFSLEIFPSLTDSQGRILKISHLKRIPLHD